jgi:hypothetical protein
VAYATCINEGAGAAVVTTDGGDGGERLPA